LSNNQDQLGARIDNIEGRLGEHKEKSGDIEKVNGLISECALNIKSLQEHDAKVETTVSTYTTQIYNLEQTVVTLPALTQVQRQYEGFEASTRKQISGIQQSLENSKEERATLKEGLENQLVDQQSQVRTKFEELEMKINNDITALNPIRLDLVLLATVVKECAQRSVADDIIKDVTRLEDHMKELQDLPSHYRALEHIVGRLDADIPPEKLKLICKEIEELKSQREELKEMTSNAAEDAVKRATEGLHTSSQYESTSSSAESLAKQTSDLQKLRTMVERNDQGVEAYEDLINELELSVLAMKADIQNLYSYNKEKTQQATLNKIEQDRRLDELTTTINAKFVALENARQSPSGITDARINALERRIEEQINGVEKRIKKIAKDTPQAADIKEHIQRSLVGYVPLEKIRGMQDEIDQQINRAAAVDQQIKEAVKNIPLATDIVQQIQSQLTGYADTGTVEKIREEVKRLDSRSENVIRTETVEKIREDTARLENRFQVYAATDEIRHDRELLERRLEGFASANIIEEAKQEIARLECQLKAYVNREAFDELREIIKRFEAQLEDCASTSTVNKMKERIAHLEQQSKEYVGTETVDRVNKSIASLEQQCQDYACAAMIDKDPKRLERRFEDIVSMETVNEMKADIMRLESRSTEYVSKEAIDEMREDNTLLEHRLQKFVDSRVEKTTLKHESVLKFERLFTKMDVKMLKQDVEHQFESKFEVFKLTCQQRIDTAFEAIEKASSVRYTELFTATQAFTSEEFFSSKLEMQTQLEKRAIQGQLTTPGAGTTPFSNNDSGNFVPVSGANINVVIGEMRYYLDTERSKHFDMEKQITNFRRRMEDLKEDVPRRVKHKVDELVSDLQISAKEQLKKLRADIMTDTANAMELTETHLSSRIVGIANDMTNMIQKTDKISADQTIQIGIIEANTKKTIPNFENSILWIKQAIRQINEQLQFLQLQAANQSKENPQSSMQQPSQFQQMPNQRQQVTQIQFPQRLVPDNHFLGPIQAQLQAQFQPQSQSQGQWQSSNRKQQPNQQQHIQQRQQLSDPTQRFGIPPTPVPSQATPQAQLQTHHRQNPSTSSAQPGQASPRPDNRRTRPKTTCAYCRDNKIKCISTGTTQVCNACQNQEIVCTYLEAGPSGLHTPYRPQSHPQQQQHNYALGQPQRGSLPPRPN
jgi:DNA repair exonuclease SbcCD ATPase subunit